MSKIQVEGALRAIIAAVRKWLKRRYIKGATRMTFMLDITEGKSRAELADDYLRCSRAAFHWQRIAMSLIEAAPDAVGKILPEFRAEIERMIEAYKD